VTTFPRLANAPITEALIDIQAVLPENIRIDELEAIQGRISAGYPNKESRHRFSVELQGKGAAKPDVVTADPVIDGFLARSPDGLQVVQYRLDGFTFSRLAPYIDWNSLRDEAKRTWQIYKTEARVERVKRIAVRYINSIEVSAGERIEDYLKRPSLGIPGFEGPPHSFLTREISVDSSTGVSAVVTVAMQPPADPAKKVVFLDIDVFKEFSTSPSDDEVWGFLERLREVKNAVFFGLATSKALEKFS